MKITVIGSGVAVPSLRRLTPGLVVEIEEEKILFDCGPDILHGLLEAGISHQEIDRILLTHFHPDHTLGLAHLLFASRYELNPRRKDLWIAGPVGLRELLEGFRGIYPRWLEEKEYRLFVQVISVPEWSGKGWKVKTAPVVHAPESIAYRLEDREGKSIVYSGDTGYCDSIIELAQGADLLISECSFPALADVPTHLNPARAGRVARLAGVKKMLLTHMYPPCEDIDVVEEARKEFAGEVIRAEDGMRLEV